MKVLPATAGSDWITEFTYWSTAYMRLVVAALSVFILAACNRAGSETAAAGPAASDPAQPRLDRELRLTGIVEAVHSSKVMVPQIPGQNGRQTLTHLIANGTQVKTGDIIAEFDPTQQLDAAFIARAKYEDLAHQVDQKASQNRADAEKRRADLIQAQADLSKALLEVEKAPILGEIDRQKNDVKAEIARKHVESLMKSNALHDKSDAAALRILELQRDRQKVATERAQTNIDRLQIHAQLPGMVAYQNVFRGNTNGHAQEGDQLWNGQAVVSIFDPTEMLVRCLVGEPDGAALTAGVRARVYLDAYPDLVLPAHFEFASPMAASALGSPIKTFTVVFKLDKTDPRLLPDLSAAVVIEPASSGGGK
jgi:multidrug efflux pump subunit AcrA (membrane-fusion protein)